MKEFWNERYGEAAYAYGEAPNAFFKAQLDRLPAGAILLPAEGEGRNAVYAASLGWQVCAFDQSEEGRKKALQLAARQGLTIDYIVDDTQSLPYQIHQFDAIGLIFAHFHGSQKHAIHQLLATYLKPGGIVILEAFSKNHIHWQAKNEQVGGPRDIDTLCSKEEVMAFFPDFEILYLEEEEIHLSEGLYHNGTGSVIRFVGKKNND